MQQSPPQNEPKLSYNASYYAYVNGSGAASGQTAVLISRMKFKGNRKQNFISTLRFPLIIKEKTFANNAFKGVFGS